MNIIADWREEQGRRRLIIGFGLFDSWNVNCNGCGVTWYHSSFTEGGFGARWYHLAKEGVGNGNILWTAN